MSVPIKTTLKVSRIGASSGIIIPAYIVEALKLEDQEIIELELNNIFAENTKPITMILKILNIGGSKGIIIPSHILGALKLKNDDLVEIKIDYTKLRKFWEDFN